MTDDDGFDLRSQAGEREDGVSVEEAFDWGVEEPSDAEEEIPDVVRCSIAGRSYAFRAEHVVEVANVPQLTSVPGLPAHVAGIAIHRRNVIGVIELAPLLGVAPSTTPLADRRVLLLTAGDVTAGILVDHIDGLEVWPEDATEDKLLDDVEDLVRDVALAARWAPGGVVVLLDAPSLVANAAVR